MFKKLKKLFAKLEDQVINEYYEDLLYQISRIKEEIKRLEENQ